MAKSDICAKHVEWKLALVPDTYKTYKVRHWHFERKYSKKTYQEKPGKKESS